MLESKWGLRFVALILAVFFFLSVNNVFGNIFNTDDLSQKSSKTIQDVPVDVIYNSKDLHVTKIPENVDVNLTGPQSKLIKIENPEDLKVVVDLSGKKAGKYQKKYQVRGIDSGINYQIKPEVAHINLENKITRVMHVQPDISSNSLDPKYKISKQSISPETVKVTGGEQQLKNIAYLKATFKNSSKVNKDTNDVADVSAFDKQLNKLNVSINPNEVNLKVTVEPFSKMVKVRTKTTGKLNENKELDSVKLEDKEVEIFGNRDELQNINEITAEVDIDGISESTEKTVSFNLKYFGTDGVRGVANQELTPELAFKLGRYGGYVLAHNKGEKHPRVLVGRDTRVSGEMLESALIAGLISIGAEVMRLGVISTPGVAYLTKEMEAALGVMISASHNPVADNGIKFFGSDGFKLSDDQENEIEQLLDQTNPDLPRPVGEDIVHYSDYFEGAQKYLSYLKSTVDVNFEGLKIVLDGANGSTSSLAPFLFGDLEADTETIGCNPDGYNINEQCGSTHPEKLAEAVLETESDFGLAFDGDGDRIIAVDENGQIVDGDQIMFIIGQEMYKNQELNGNMIVSTVMSNLGFYKALEKEGIQSNKTKVGDRYVVEEMRRGNYNLGGEQSGHIVLMDYNTTGDGLLTGVQLASVIKMSGKTLSELASQMKKYPQSLINVRVTDKYRVEENIHVQEIMTKVETEMNGEGRILVRPSGTEPLVRVMVEAATDADAERYAQSIADVVEDKMGLDK